MVQNGAKLQRKYLLSWQNFLMKIKDYIEILNTGIYSVKFNRHQM